MISIIKQYANYVHENVFFMWDYDQKAVGTAEPLSSADAESITTGPIVAIEAFIISLEYFLYV